MRLLGDVLWAHPAGSSEEAVPLDIRLVRPGVYRAELTASSPGTWVLCTWEPRCAGGSSVAGYPDRIELEVASSAQDPVDAVVGGTSTEPAASRMPVPVLALAGFVVAAAALVGRSAWSRRT